MYHRATTGKYGNSPDDLEKHFEYLKKHHTVCFPGEKKGTLSLTFDDATADFYLVIFPLLKKYQLKAILGVPVGFIQEKADYSKKERLDLLKNFSFQRSPSPEAFCSYEELVIMLRSGLIKIASHSFSHQDMTLKNLDLFKEIVASKMLLEQKLHIQVEDFILPYGKYNKAVISSLSKHYKRIFRIGNSINIFSAPLFLTRISADATPSIKDIFMIKKRLIYFFKSFKNIFTHFFYH